MDPASVVEATETGPDVRKVTAAITLAATALIALAVAAPAQADTPAFFTQKLYVDPYSDSQAVTDNLTSSGDTRAASIVKTITDQPQAVWLGDWWTPTVLQSVLRKHLKAAAAQGATPVFVTYAIPNRDCGGYSAGGLDQAAYLDWNRTIATTLSGSHAVVLVEPDSLSMLAAAKCAPVAASRPGLINAAVKILNAAGLTTYIDGGNAHWLSPDQQAKWLNAAGIADARGFFTNVSTTDATQSERDYAGKVSSRVGWKHYVIDVSRNGNGWQGASWCNPAGAALGQNPVVVEGDTYKLDALLWVKHPGLSDGACDGAPAAGKWYQTAAEALVLNRR
jgi:endoglucanase